MIITTLVMVTQGLVLAAGAPAESGVRPPGNDPNEMVCVRESQIGSRVATRRVCRTRQEWDDVRRQARISTERAQNQTQTSCRPTPTMTC
jgi:hypothetical protein